MRTATVTSARPLTASGRRCAWRTEGERGVIERISKLVEIEDPVTGRVRPKAKVEDVDMLDARDPPPGPTSRPSPTHPGGLMSVACPKGHARRRRTTAACAGLAPEAPVAAATMAAQCPNCGSPPDRIRPASSAAICSGRPTSLAPWEEQNWEVVVRPDRAFYERQEPDGMDFPEQTPSRRFLLTGDHTRIGRQSTRRTIEAEIDLSGVLEDTGVSHRHAVLMRQPEGNWALVDLDSTNGTFLNADAEPILANHPVALSDGDQIHLGGWTTLTSSGSTRQPSRPWSPRAGRRRTPGASPGGADRGRSASWGRSGWWCRAKRSPSPPQDPCRPRLLALRVGRPFRSPTSSGRCGARTSPRPPDTALRGTSQPAKCCSQTER